VWARTYSAPNEIPYKSGSSNESTEGFQTDLAFVKDPLITVNQFIDFG